MHKTYSDGHAMAVGCGLGALSGLMLGALFSLILGDMPLWLKGILLVHTVAAMTVMGAWTMPCFLTGETSPEEL